MRDLHHYGRCCRNFILILILSISGLESKAQLFNQDSLKLISRQFSFTEGPAVNKEGAVYFTDQPNNQIWKYGTDGKLSLYIENAGRSNGLYFDHKGILIACADEHNQLWAIAASKKTTILLDDFKGKKLNGPNDLWIDAQGGIYFTDPYYQRDYWTRKKPEMDGQKVYYLTPGKKAVLRVAADNLTKPNGIVGSADGKYLYVADIERNKTYQYTVGKNGALSNQQVLIDKGSDGMTIDAQGNFYLTGNGVFIYNPQGVQIGHILINEPWTANVCFGGKNRSDLFITASTAVYVLPMNVKGLE